MKDNVDIFPERIATTHDTNTGKTHYTNIYTLDNWADLGFVGILICLAVLGIALPILSGLMLLFFIIESNPSNRIVLGIVGALAAAYVLLDIKNNWLMTTIMHFFYDSKEFVFIKPFNFTMLIINVIAIFLGEAILNIIPNKNRGILFVIFLVFSMIIYFIIK